MREAGRRTHFLNYPGPLIAQEALDCGPAERADVVDASGAVAGVPEQACLRDKRTTASDFQVELFVPSERQTRGGDPPRVESAPEG